mgnify:CR=1 FL=1
MSLMTLAGPQKYSATLGAIMSLVAMDLNNDVLVSFIDGAARVIVRQQCVPLIDESELDDIVHDQLNEWVRESLPHGHHLIDILGEPDYFLNADESWCETFGFNGEACEWACSAAESLRDELEYFPDAKEAITEELIEDFYQFWRSRFFCNILVKYRTLSSRRSLG